MNNNIYIVTTDIDFILDVLQDAKINVEERWFQSHVGAFRGSLRYVTFQTHPYFDTYDKLISFLKEHEGKYRIWVEYDGGSWNEFIESIEEFEKIIEKHNDRPMVTSRAIANHIDYVDAGKYGWIRSEFF